MILNGPNLKILLILGALLGLMTYFWNLRFSKYHDEGIHQVFKGMSEANVDMFWPQLSFWLKKADWQQKIDFRQNTFRKYYIFAKQYISLMKKNNILQT